MLGKIPVVGPVLSRAVALSFYGIVAQILGAAVSTSRRRIESPASEPEATEPDSGDSHGEPDSDQFET
jgi:hypothetical protein